MTTSPGVWILAGLACLLAGGLLSLACGTRSGRASTVAIVACLLAAGLGVPPALQVLLSGASWETEVPWSMPWGTLSFGLDGLSALFLIFVLVLAVPAAAYGKGYMAHHGESRWTGASWALFQVLVASMLVVVLARDGLLFLIAWEAMALASFLLVIHDHRQPGVRSDALVYLVAAHLGAAALAAMFGLWGTHVGSLSFAALAAAPPGAKAAWALFLLALAGFGSKAGLAPVHVWLPRAHPAAPSHVSALMSGVMIKMGIYGLMRVLLMLGPPRVAWGYVLMGVGALSALGGITCALAQRDIKRSLAYSSVDNVGVVAMAMGAGLLARTAGLPVAANLLFAGAAFHVLNHGLFKSLLFMAGGAAAQASGTRDLESMGGLLRRMPFTGGAFAAGALSISALPPFNGLVGEWLIMVGLLEGMLAGRGDLPVVFLAALALLALVGGLVLACFARIFGVAFLGQPRSAGAAESREVSAWMLAPMVLTAAACAAVGLAAPALLPVVAPAARALAGGAGPVGWGLSEGAGPLAMVVMAGGGVVVLTAALLGWRWALLRSRPVTQGPTWGCGFTAPTARMQTTASSFAGPLLAVLATTMRPVLRKRRPKGVFPRGAAFSSSMPDPADRGLFDPVVRGLERLASAMRPLQHGHLQAYLLYVLVVLVGLLIWEVFT